MKHSEATVTSAPVPQAEFVNCVGYLLIDEDGDYTFTTDADEIGSAAKEANLHPGYRVVELDVLASKPSTPRADAIVQPGQSRVSIVTRDEVTFP